MYKKIPANKTQINSREAEEGETIETKVMRILKNNEPIKDGAPIIFTDRKDGIKPQYDIRTDRFELAIEATDNITKSHLAKRELAIGERTYDTMNPDEQKAFNEKFPSNKHNPKTTDEGQA